MVFDDDGKTAYAYLKLGETIVADVWLYNVVDIPRTPEWQEVGAREKMPFANPAGFARVEPFEPINDPDDIDLDWQAPQVSGGSRSS
ncbi:hypothetical protein [Dongia deserti]|uniref:hypothetical protein n=1 Tax=Dongia deserti TaxID=2268030 RepID=UPI000E658B12|nr:hypothetical protein [Dongia deserti]